MLVEQDVSQLAATGGGNTARVLRQVARPPQAELGRGDDRARADHQEQEQWQ